MDDKGSCTPRDPEPEIRAPRTPYLHLRIVEGLLFEEAIVITCNAKATLRLRDQVDRALRNDPDYPFEEGVYKGTNGTPFEVVVKKAREREKMREP